MSEIPRRVLAKFRWQEEHMTGEDYTVRSCEIWIFHRQMLDQIKEDWIDGTDNNCKQMKDWHNILMGNRKENDHLVEIDITKVWHNLQETAC
jgi:hypothetical protein